jgi:hypothetical protein
LALKLKTKEKFLGLMLGVMMASLMSSLTSGNFKLYDILQLKIAKKNV